MTHIFAITIPLSLSGRSPSQVLQPPYSNSYRDLVFFCFPFHRWRPIIPSRPRAISRLFPLSPNFALLLPAIFASLHQVLLYLEFIPLRDVVWLLEFPVEIPTPSPTGPGIVPRMWKFFRDPISSRRSVSGRISSKRKAREVID